MGRTGRNRWKEEEEEGQQFFFFFLAGGKEGRKEGRKGEDVNFFLIQSVFS